MTIDQMHFCSGVILFTVEDSLVVSIAVTVSFGYELTQDELKLTN